MPTDRDSTAILRHLEASPQDADARRCLADALADEGKDEVFAFGVNWLVRLDIWLAETPGANADARFRIDAGGVLGLGIDRLPFSGPVFGPTAEGVLRAFAGHLWAFFAWIEDVKNAVVPKPKVNRRRRRPEVPAEPAETPTETPWPVADDPPWAPPSPWPVAPWRTRPARPPREMWCAKTDAPILDAMTRKHDSIRDALASIVTQRRAEG